MKQQILEEFYQVNPKYVEELYLLQTELLKLQQHLRQQQQRLLILFEGRDTAGKGSAIHRFTQFLDPRGYRVVALGKPSDEERGQWYFQRYLKHLPGAGEMVFFDRSWYNRAVVEPVMGFCTEVQYELFMQQVVPLEQMLVADGIVLVKFWFSIDMQEQQERIQQRLESPLKRWKVSPVDLAAQEKWEAFTAYKEKMYEQTHTAAAPWLIVKGEDREDSRIQCMRYVLASLAYEGKSPELEQPDQAKIFFP